MKNTNINKIRVKLDNIDIKLLKIIKKRSLLVDRILKHKKNKKEIIDQKRINFILKKIKKYSLKIKLDPKISNNIWKAMIKSFINYEFRKFKKN
jgi:chorismate mutase|tara:strand:+ start:191 stop:472 length:282 start_codon:yes stop_codon:yes gene_type:complete